ncbi:MAG TPA: MarR family transcriptional regulator [Noviherbaspirillum sp.]|nr:MarR family transcriptional regulator [Noviherbaspirillum sp.]
MKKPYSVKNYSLDESIGFLLKRAGTQLALCVDRRLAEFDMTHAQYGIFRRLQTAPSTAADLARSSMTDTGAMTRMLDRLEEKGFVQRSRSSTDRRVVEVSLTDKGRQIADRMTEVAVDMLNQHLHGFTLNEVEQFKIFLRRMINNASQHE